MGKYKPGSVIEFEHGGEVLTGTVVRSYNDSDLVPVYCDGVEYQIRESDILAPAAQQKELSPPPAVHAAAALVAPIVKPMYDLHLVSAIIASGIAARGKFDGEHRVAHEAVKIANALIKEIHDVNSI